MSTNPHFRTSQGKNDECYTKRYGVEAILPYLEKFSRSCSKDIKIWCPFDTEASEYVKVFKENGYNVINSHIEYGQDFFSYKPKEYDVIISNPPFSGKKEIFERALRLKKPFALLMTIQWLNDPAPAKLFMKYGAQLQILSFDERMTFKNQPQNKISYLSAYFCKDFLTEALIFETLKTNIDQQKLKL